MNDIKMPRFLSVPSSDIDGAIHDAVRGHLILYPIYEAGGNFGAGDRIYSDVNGFGLLNQMKMKEAVDQLVSIRRFFLVFL